MSDVFTSPDPRLRHADVAPDAYASRRVSDGNGGYKLVPYSYFITATTFPALYARVAEMQERAGVPHFRLVAVPHQPRGAFIDFDNKLINISIPYLNVESFKGIEFAFGHEIGHHWRATHPNHTPPRQLSSFPKMQWLEVEADIFGTCLTGDKATASAALRRLPPPTTDDHPPSTSRAAAVASITDADCAVFDLPAPRTPSVSNGKAPKAALK